MITPRIMCVDDEDAIRNLLVRFLQGLPVQVLEARDGQEALELFREEHPEIVLTDVRMPRMDGLQLTHQILAHQRQTYVVIITGHGTEQTAIEALQAGAVNYLKKPFSLKELRSVLDKLLARVFQQKAERLPAEMIEQSYLQIRIPSNFDLLPGVLRTAHRLLDSHFDDDHWHQIRLGIDEMVTNAIEHGNLGITCEEKQQGIEAESLLQLIQSRSTDPRYSNRKITIEWMLDPQGFTCTITDEGDGFDWRSLPDPRDPTNLLKNHGRGILLTQLNFDQVSYNEKGNQVRLYKRIPKTA